MDRDWIDERETSRERANRDAIDRAEEDDARGATHPHAARSATSHPA